MTAVLPDTFYNNQVSSLRSSNSVHSIHLSNLSQSKSNNKNQVNLISDMLSTSKNSFHSISKQYSIPSNVGTFENMLDDITNNVIDKRRENLNEVGFEYQKLVQSIEELERGIKAAKEENEIVEQSILTYQNDNSKIMMEIERYKAENFHNKIEIVFLKKKIQEKEDQINALNKEARDFNYNQYKIMTDSLRHQKGMKNDSGKIDELINEKKNLSTAIVILNKKINVLKKNIATHVYKGELFIDEFGKLVEREKMTKSTIES